MYDIFVMWLSKKGLPLDNKTGYDNIYLSTYWLYLIHQKTLGLVPLPTSGHTGISAQNFFRSNTNIAPLRFFWVSKEVEKLKKLTFVYFTLCFSLKKNILKTSKNQNLLKVDYLGSFYYLFNFTEKQLTKSLKMNIKNLVFPREKKYFFSLFTRFFNCDTFKLFFHYVQNMAQFCLFQFKPFWIRSIWSQNYKLLQGYND